MSTLVSIFNAPQVESQTEQMQMVDVLLSMDLDALANVDVISAAGRPQKKSEAAAIISVISKEDIQQWQYQSVAEALQQIPGIHCINNLVSYNCGIRGINGGMRAYNRIMKVMINGQSIAFRSSGANFIGPELIPMSIIEKIEVIRGPVSALYGADAFLGVINIITQLPSEASQKTQLNIVQSTTNDNSGYLFSAQTLGKNNRSSYSLAVSKAKYDRSGLTVPDTIPANAAIKKPNLVAGNQNINDTAEPANIFGQWRYQNGQHDLSLSGQFSRLDSYAEFLDFGELSHANRVSIESGFLRIEDYWSLTQSLSIKGALAYSKGKPSSKESLSFGDANTHPRRDFGYSATDLLLELHYTVNEAHQLTLGLDTRNDKETLISIYNVDNTTAAETLVSNEGGEVTFKDQGYYLQYLGNIAEKISLTLNARRDDHSIYGVQDSYRTGLIYKINSKINSKLLYGTAFKAPAAMQLFAQPLFSGEIEGNPNLKSELVTTLEFAMDGRITKTTSYEFNIYQSKLSDKVEFVAGTAKNVTTQNRGEQNSRGIEGEFLWVYSKHSIILNGAYQKTEVDTINILSQNNQNDSALYPVLMANLFWKYQFTHEKHLGLQWHYVSERRASDQNI
ncbi:MAG: TonB-dependent receptor plug domain-containing protein, partial [Thiohalomonadales bacterium]